MTQRKDSENRPVCLYWSSACLESRIFLSLFYGNLNSFCVHLSTIAVTLWKNKKKYKLHYYYLTKPPISSKTRPHHTTRLTTALPAKTRLPFNFQSQYLNGTRHGVYWYFDGANIVVFNCLILPNTQRGLDKVQYLGIQLPTVNDPYKTRWGVFAVWLRFSFE